MLTVVQVGVALTVARQVVQAVVTAVQVPVNKKPSLTVVVLTALKPARTVAQESVTEVTAQVSAVQAVQALLAVQDVEASVMAVQTVLEPVAVVLIIALLPVGQAVALSVRAPVQEVVAQDVAVWQE